MATCDRCHRQTRITTVSWFSTETICPACSDEETGHPDYRYARQQEREAVLRGDYNFPGVGWPGKDGRVRQE